MVCLKCYSFNDGDAIQCAKCGQNLHSTDSKSMYTASLVENNLKSLFLYVLVNIFSILLVYGFLYILFFTKLEKVNVISNATNILVFSTNIVILVLLGFKLEHKNIKNYNWFSVSAIEGIGLLLWFYCYLQSPDSFDLKGIWLLYVLYMGWFVPAIYVFEPLSPVSISGHTICLYSFIVAFIPPLLIRYGLFLKQRKHINQTKKESKDSFSRKT